MSKYRSYKVAPASGKHEVVIVARSYTVERSGFVTFVDERGDRIASFYQPIYVKLEGIL